MRRTRRVGAAVALAAAVACAGSGCTVIPVSGPYTVSDTGGGDPLNKPFQRMIAIPPRDDWDPELLIKGLQAAMAAYPDDPAVLARYLTPKAQAKWKASGPVTVIEDAYQVEYPGEGDEAETYGLKGKQVARIDPDDAYVPLSGNAPERLFVLKKDARGVYRVDDLPDGLLLTKSDVARAYRLTNLYYLNSARERLVVDRVCLRLKPTETFAQTIVKRLLKGPSSALRGAVGTVFPEGTRVESVGTGEDRVLVNFSGPLLPLDLGEKAALVAQLKYSLTNNKVANSRTIEVQVDGEQYWTEPPNLEAHWLDNGGGTPYYTSKGSVHVMSNEGPGVAVSGPAGEGNTDFKAFALSTQQTGAIVAARTSTGISVAGLTPEGRWQQVIEGADLTDPTWRRDGSLWTFDQHNKVVLRYDPNGGRGPERVSAPGLDGLDVTAFRIARDGVRVALRTGKNTVQLGALSEGLNGPMLGNLQTLTSTEVEYEIEDIAWEDDEHLLVLIKSKAGQILNEIDVGDGETIGIPLKDRLAGVTALSGRVLAEASTDKGPKIIELNQDRQGWTSKIEPNAKNPFFPLG
ncbi:MULTISPECIES: LpqB family beta-propeller domain-containing protein [unclassified Nonomuraea]|uniref:LpqB family beta-propeller domain-containing protein n=1 Tax=unclassified Nonomuraea TaxID=2593643 RepID=UPI0033FC7A97